MTGRKRTKIAGALAPTADLVDRRRGRALTPAIEALAMFADALARPLAFERLAALEATARLDGVVALRLWLRVVRHPGRLQRMAADAKRPAHDDGILVVMRDAEGWGGRGVFCLRRYDRRMLGTDHGARAMANRRRTFRTTGGGALRQALHRADFRRRRIRARPQRATQSDRKAGHRLDDHLAASLIDPQSPNRRDRFQRCATYGRRTASRSSR